MITFFIVRNYIQPEYQENVTKYMLITEQIRPYMTPKYI
jgi:hypothetical protein